MMLRISTTGMAQVTIDQGDAGTGLDTHQQMRLEQPPGGRPLCGASLRTAHPRPVQSCGRDRGWHPGPGPAPEGRGKARP